MATKPYKKHKRGAGRHVQLPEWLQSSKAWATLKPGPRALYVELKRRYNGVNNGRIHLSHRDAAKALNAQPLLLASATADSHTISIEREGAIQRPFLMGRNRNNIRTYAFQAS